MIIRHLCRSAIALAAVLLGVSTHSSAAVSAEDMTRLYDVRDWDEHQAGDVARLKEDLDAKYTTDGDRSIIYYRIAQAHQCRGFDAPLTECEEIIRKALVLPQSAPAKMQLYTIWGDAIIRAHYSARGSALSEPRRLAAEKYLLALKIAIQEKLPQTAPPRPEFPLPESPIMFPPNYDPARVAKYNLAVKSYEENFARARKELDHVMEQEKMIVVRDSVIGQIVSLYAKFPFSDEGLKGMCDRLLQDKATADQLLKMVATKHEERARQMGNSKGQL